MTEAPIEPQVGVVAANYTQAMQPLADRWERMAAAMYGMPPDPNPFPRIHLFTRSHDKLTNG